MFIKDRTGETNIANNGKKITIIAYRKYNDIDVQSEDGHIYRHTKYASFKSGSIGKNYHYKDRTGETNIANNGMKITIIAYRTANDIDVQFEDGAIVTHTQYYSFRIGCVGHPKRISLKPHPNSKSSIRIGETKIANNGLKMTIEQYNSATDLAVRFENGVLVEHRAYKEFKLGKIGCPEYGKYQKRYIGKTKIATNGQKMTVIDWFNWKNMTVQFEDGTIVKNVANSSFRAGTVINPNYTHKQFIADSYIGQTNRAKNGLLMTIIDYRRHNDIDIQFEDGIIVKHKQYQCFKYGIIKHPYINCHFIDKTGETNISNDGLNMKIIKYNCSDDCTIEFETGFITEHKIYNNFLNKRIGHVFPYQMNNIKIEKLAYLNSDKTGNFYCTCTKCGHKDIWTIEEAKNHICEEFK